MDWQKITDKTNKCAEDTDAKRYREFVETFGFNKQALYKHVHHLNRLLNGNDLYNSGKFTSRYSSECHQNDWVDHGEIYKIDGTDKIVIVGHVYSREQTMKRAQEIAEYHNVAFAYSDPEYDWYYPNGTTTYFFMSNDNLEWFKSQYKHDLNVVEYDEHNYNRMLLEQLLSLNIAPAEYGDAFHMNPEKAYDEVVLGKGMNRDRFKDLLNLGMQYQSKY